MCVYLQVISFLLKSTNRGQAWSGRPDGTLRSCCFTIAVLCHSSAARHRSHYLIPLTQCTAKIKSRLKVLIIPDTRNSADSPVSEVTVRSFDGAPDTKLLARYEAGLPHKFLFKGEKISVLLVFVTASLGFAESLNKRMFLPRKVPHVRQTPLLQSLFEIVHNHYRFPELTTDICCISFLLSTYQ